MLNSVLFFAAVVFYLSAVIAAYRWFGEAGLYVFTAISAILANIQVCKNIDILGLSTTAGNALYAASFLVTDILSENHGKKAAKKAVYIGIFTTIIFLVGTQGLLRFTPNANDIMDAPMQMLFGLAPRVAIASIIGYICSQTIDVTLYHFIWKKTGDNEKMLWLRNCGSTLLSQAVDTIVFTSVAFWGVYNTEVFFSILLTTYLFKAIVAFCDTPFVYLARKAKRGGAV